MTRSETLHLLPYIGSLALSLGVLIFAWHRRESKGVVAYLWYASGQTIWIFGFILELITPSLEDKIIWDGLQWVASLMIIVALPVFAVQYSEYKLNDPRRLFIFSLIGPALFMLMLLTDGLHHLVYQNPRIVMGVNFPELIYDFSWFVILFSIYLYGVMFWGIRILLRRLCQPHTW